MDGVCAFLANGNFIREYVFEEIVCDRKKCAERDLLKALECIVSTIPVKTTYAINLRVD